MGRASSSSEDEKGALGTKFDEDDLLRSSPAHLSSRQSFSGQRARDKQPAEGGQSAVDDASETSWLEETGETSAELLVEELQQHRQRADTASTHQQQPTAPPSSAGSSRPSIAVEEVAGRGGGRAA
ncbi:uncharacterized protein LOC144114737 [Amblyomma americanum]